MTERPGFRFAYAFESEVAADSMRRIWSNGPPVLRNQVMSPPNF